MWPHAECPRRRIARRERPHDVVVDLGFAHLLAALPYVSVLATFAIVCHTEMVSDALRLASFESVIAVSLLRIAPDKRKRELDVVPVLVGREFNYVAANVDIVFIGRRKQFVKVGVAVSVNSSYQ